MAQRNDTKRHDMKTFLLLTTLASLALCLLLCRTFDSIQDASRANPERALVAQLSR